MTRSKQILILLVSLVALAVSAPAASAASAPDGWRYASVEPNPIKWGRVTPNPRASAEQPNPFRIRSLPSGIRYGSLQPNPRSYVTPNPRLAPMFRVVRF